MEERCSHGEFWTQFKLCGAQYMKKCAIPNRFFDVIWLYCFRCARMWQSTITTSTAAKVQVYLPSQTLKHWRCNAFSVSTLLSKSSHETINFINYANAIMLILRLYSALRAHFFPIDSAHGAHQASRIIVDLAAKRTGKAKKKNQIRKNERAREVLQRWTAIHDKGYLKLWVNTYVRRTLVSKLVRTFDHVGLSQSNNREPKQRKSKDTWHYGKYLKERNRQ